MRWRLRTIRIHGHVNVLNGAIFAKDVAQMVLVDVLGEFLNYNLRTVSKASESVRRAWIRTFVLRGGGVRLWLLLMLRVRSLPLLRERSLDGVLLMLLRLPLRRLYPSGLRDRRLVSDGVRDREREREREADGGEMLRAIDRGADSRRGGGVRESLRERDRNGDTIFRRYFAAAAKQVVACECKNVVQMHTPAPRKETSSYISGLASDKQFIPFVLAAGSCRVRVRVNLVALAELQSKQQTFLRGIKLPNTSIDSEPYWNLGIR